MTSKKQDMFETTKKSKSPKVKEVETTPVETVKPKKEIGGPAGPEPTRFGDWEKNGRCSDF